MTRRRICMVVTEVLGLERNGGIATATTHMSMILAGLGHYVEVLHCGHRTDLDENWADQYRAAGVRIRILDRSVAVMPVPAAESWSVYQTLKHEDFDAVVFQDWRGMGAVSMLAKRAGAAFGRTTFIHHVHSPTAWIQEANRQVDIDADLAIVSHMERTSAELADHIVGPSQHLIDWMLQHGWQLPESRTMIPYFTAGQVEDLDRPLASDPPDTPLTELVFFGRLEERKGVSTFVSALNQLGATRTAGLTVTFLGRPAHFTPDEVRSFFEPEVIKALNGVQFLTDVDQPGARAYLQGPGRLAVMPSHLDNSPNVVYECIEDRIPFVASRSGGTGELVHPDDRATTLFDPSPASLVDRLGPLVDERRLPRPARPAFDGPRSLKAWMSLLTPAEQRVVVHETPLVSVIIPHHDRPRLLRHAVDSVARQDYPNVEIVVVDDGSALPESQEALDRLDDVAMGRPLTVVRQDNRYLGAARNTGARAAKGELLAFLDDDDLAAPSYVSAMVTAAYTADADAVSCAFETIDGSYEGAPRPQDRTGVWLFFGGPLSLGTMVNVFGGAGALIRRAMFDKIGGFREERGITHEDWLLFVRVALSGGRIATVPDPLYRYRYRAGSMIRTTSLYANSKIVNDAYAEVLPPELEGWPLLLRGLHERLEQSKTEMQELKSRVSSLEDELDRRLRYIAVLDRRRLQP